MDTTRDITTVDTVVIGGGQAGLVMGYHLRRSGRSFVILEGSPRIGDSWRHRYDSLRLFSFPKYSSLPGMRIPVERFPNRDEMADYLHAYAAHFQLPVRTGVRVVGVGRDGNELVVRTATGWYAARNVLVATGAHVRPHLPVFAAELDPAIRQLHSLDYRNTSQLAPGGVLVVGAANSGTDIAIEAAAAGHPTWLAGRHPGQIPIDIDKPSARPVVPLIMFAFRHVLTLRTPMGRRMRDDIDGHGLMLIRNKLADLEAAGVSRVGRVSDVVDGRPVTADGALPDISTVVWCTGSGPDHGFIDLSVTDESGRLRHDRGVAAEPGLYFLGLDFMFAAASSTIQGLDRDARYLLRHLRPASSRSGSDESAAPLRVAG